MLQVLIFILLGVDLIEAKSCVTPYQEKATCVPLFSCNVITSALATLTPQAFALAKDSKCGCDMETVCCGSFNNKTYPPLIDCAPPPSPEKVLSSLVLSDVSVCGLHSFTDRIKGGTAVKLDEFPWIAALEFKSIFTNESVGIRCGGSIIHKRYVLTAAHCILNVEFIIVKVWLGVTNITSERNCVRSSTGHDECADSIQKINVEETIPHESYDSIDKFNDIGLLRLEKEIEFSDYIRPICLPSPDSEPPKNGTYLTVAGWGTKGNGKLSDVKLKVDVPLMDNQVCNEYLKKREREITPKQLCVGGERGKDSCEGDSGGPLMYGYGGTNNDVQWYQQGIVSYGSGCGNQGKPAVYVKVSSYANWILRKLYKLNLNLGKGDTCTTPHHTTGKCVPITTCGVISKAASSKNETAYEFVSDSYCGDDVDGTLVCCENPGSVIRPNFDSTALPDKTTCGVVKSQPGLEGTEFPWVAGIEVSPENFDLNEIRCVGTVLNSRYVLTSAECVFRSERDPINVWLGHWNSSGHDSCKTLSHSSNCGTNPVQKIGIKKLLKHPFYTRLSYGSYDIALIFLESEIQFSDYISPICLTLPELPQLESGVRLTSLKWNEHAENTLSPKPYTTRFVSSSDMMLKEEITLVSIDECTKNLAIKGQYLQTSLDLCARDAHGRSCDRHFGAPLMRSYQNESNGTVQWYLEGVVAFTNNECSLKDYPGSYLKITGYLDWIINVISED